MASSSRDRKKKRNNLKVFVGDRFNIFRDFSFDDSGCNNEDRKSKEVLECSTRSSVSETGESLHIPSSNHNPTSAPPETNSNPIYIPRQPEKPSRVDVSMGASSLVQIWEARSQQSNSTLSQSLNNSRTSSELSLSDMSNSSFGFLDDEAIKNNENSSEDMDWRTQSNMSNGSDELVTCTPRIRVLQAYEDLCEMILRDRKNDLEWLNDRYAVSKFSPKGYTRLQFMLNTRTLENCLAIQGRRRPKKSVATYVNRSTQRSDVMNLGDICKEDTKKGSEGNVNSAAETGSSSRTVSSRANKTGGKNVLQETMEKGKQRETDQDANSKPKIIMNPVLSEAECSKKREAEGTFRKAMEVAIVKENEETNMSSSLTIAEKVSLYDSKERYNEDKATRRVTGMETVEINKERIKIKEIGSFKEGKSMEIQDIREVTSEICLDISKEEENENYISKESGEEKISSEDNEETSKESSETLCLDGSDEKEMEDEQEYEESVHYDWTSDISQPQSYWKDLRKQRELEAMNNESEKDDTWSLIKRRTVSSFLASDFREKIDRFLISRAQKRLEVEKDLAEEEEEDSEEKLVECSERHQQKLEGSETEKVDLETVTVSDDSSNHSLKSTMMTWSFKDNEVAAAISLNPRDHENTYSVICELREDIKQLRREILELQGLVKSCVDFQKSVNKLLPRE